MRVQLKRTKGYRKPAEAVNIKRYGKHCRQKWGNPFPVVNGDNRTAVDRFERWLANGGAPELERQRQWILDHVHELRGRMVACSCALDEPCHGDVLIRRADGSTLNEPC